MASEEGAAHKNNGGGDHDGKPPSPPPVGAGERAEGEATLLVSEFPPPPYYYSTTDISNLQPPDIPHEALARGTQRAAAAAAQARAEAERERQQQQDDDKTDAILGGGVGAAKGDGKGGEEGDVVAVFGEIVEDPDLVEPLDHCEDPKIVRDAVKKLNHEVLQRFVQLVQDLVHRPLENKKTRDDLSDCIFRMLQECNKFREHQAREIMIELLEQQLEERRKLVQELKQGIATADELLSLPSEPMNNEEDETHQ